MQPVSPTAHPKCGESENATNEPKAGAEEDAVNELKALQPQRGRTE